MLEFSNFLRTKQTNSIRFPARILNLCGFGVKTGNYVSVGFGGANCGFLSYEVKSDGTLDGKWGSSGSTELGTETAKKKSK